MMAGMSTTGEPPEPLPELTESEYLGADAPAPETPLKTRALLPLVIPLLSIAIVAVLVLNISRVFLAGNKDTALAMAIVITLAILIGASLVAAAPRMSTSATALVLGFVLVGISIAGFVSLGASLNAGEGGGGNPLVNPAGRATSTVKVVAGPGLSFDGVKFTGNYDAKAGIVQIDYGGAAGHTLAIQDPKFDGFLLKSDGAPRSGKVKITPGKYTIYCTVPGHEAAGMKATLTVAAK
jgi:Copper binding proteins, plastocyanin/azurin family